MGAKLAHHLGNTDWFDWLNSRCLIDVVTVEPHTSSVIQVNIVGVDVFKKGLV